MVDFAPFHHPFTKLAHFFSRLLALSFTLNLFSGQFALSLPILVIPVSGFVGFGLLLYLLRGHSAAQVEDHTPVCKILERRLVFLVIGLQLILVGDGFGRSK